MQVFTDGSCLGNPGPGGWAAILRYNQTEKELGGGFALTTNNRMELLAAIQALSALKQPCTVDLYTDSRYLVDAVEKKWLTAWQNNGWKKSAKQPVKNQDLWEMLLPLLNKHKIKWHWVRGHVGHPENERCDVLAKNQASQPALPPDQGFSPDEV